MLSFNKLIMLSPTKTEDRQRRWRQWHRDNNPGRAFVVISCFVSSSPNTLPLSSLFFSSIFSWCKSILLFLRSNLSSGSSGGGEFGDKSVGSWGVLGKPKARRRSTGLLRRAVIILVTCYRRACSSLYLQLLLPLGAHFNAWGWLLCNEFRNTGSRCKKRRETREARNHWPITNRSARKKKYKEVLKMSVTENAGERDNKTVSLFSSYAWQLRANKSPQSGLNFVK